MPIVLLAALALAQVLSPAGAGASAASPAGPAPATAPAPVPVASPASPPQAAPPAAAPQPPVPSAAAPAPPAGVPLQGTVRDFDVPPPGTPADQALWKEGYEVNNEILLALAAANEAQWTAHAAAYDRRLGELAGKGGPGSSAAGEARQRLLDRWRATNDVVTRQWPVDPTRACRYEQLYLDSAMMSGAPAVPVDLPEARRNLRQCLDKARLVLTALAAATRGLQESLAEADQLLGAAGAGTPPGAAAP
jgi:hypothetical protein